MSWTRGDCRLYTVMLTSRQTEAIFFVSVSCFHRCKNIILIRGKPSGMANYGTKDLLDFPYSYLFYVVHIPGLSDYTPLDNLQFLTPTPILFSFIFICEVETLFPGLFNRLSEIMNMLRWFVKRFQMPSAAVFVMTVRTGWGEGALFYIGWKWSQMTKGDFEELS